MGNELDLRANSIGNSVLRATTWTVATFAALFLLALVTGVFWGTWFTLSRSITTFAAAEFIHIGQTIIANVAWPLRFLMPACILTMIFSAWLLPEKNSVAFYLSTLACLAVIIALLITLIVEVPIDNQIRDLDSNHNAFGLDDDSRPLGAFSYGKNVCFARKPGQFHRSRSNFQEANLRCFAS